MPTWKPSTGSTRPAEPPTRSSARGGADGSEPYDDEANRHQRERKRERPQGAVQRPCQVRDRELEHPTVGQPLLSAYRKGAPPERSNGGAKAPLSDAQGETRCRYEKTRGADRKSVGPEAGQSWKRPPRGGKPKVGVETPPEELQVVSEDDEGAGRDERGEAEGDDRKARNADRHCAGEAGDGQNNQGAIRQASAERPAIQLVERMGAN